MTDPDAAVGYLVSDPDTGAETVWCVDCIHGLALLRHSLVDDRGEWQQRMQAVLTATGCPKRADLLSNEKRAWVCQLPLPTTGREQVAVGLTIVDAIDFQLQPINKQLRAYARRQLCCKALQRQYGNRRADRRHGSRRSRRRAPLLLLARGGPLRQHGHHRTPSEKRRAPGHLSRQGPPAPRWALYGAAQRARFPASPDSDYYLQLAERIGGNRPCLALARKPLKRSYHILKVLGDDALKPAVA